MKFKLQMVITEKRSVSIWWVGVGWLHVGEAPKSNSKKSTLRLPSNWKKKTELLVEFELKSQLWNPSRRLQLIASKKVLNERKRWDSRRIVAAHCSTFYILSFRFSIIFFVFLVRFLSFVACDYSVSKKKIMWILNEDEDIAKNVYHKFFAIHSEKKSWVEGAYTPKPQRGENVVRTHTTSDEMAAVTVLLWRWTMEIMKNNDNQMAKLRKETDIKCKRTK